MATKAYRTKSRKALREMSIIVADNGDITVHGLGLTMSGLIDESHAKEVVAGICAFEPDGIIAGRGDAYKFALYEDPSFPDCVTVIGSGGYFNVFDSYEAARWTLANRYGDNGDGSEIVFDAFARKRITKSRNPHDWKTVA